MTNNRLKDMGLFDTDTNITPTIISVLSGKGGVGKSVIAFNLSAIAAEAGYRSLVIDADWYFGNIHILANAIPERTLGDIIFKGISASNTAVPLGDKWHMIASPAALGSELKFSSDDIRSFFEKTKRIFNDYEYIFIDTASANIEIIEIIAGIADLNLIIINPELTSIADGYGIFKYLVRVRQDILGYLFMNRVQSEDDYAFIYQKFTVLAQKFLNRVPLNAGFMLDDRHIIESVAHQSPLIGLKGDSNSVHQLTRLFNFIAKECQMGADYLEFQQPSSINFKKATADIKE